MQRFLAWALAIVLRESITHRRRFGKSVGEFEYQVFGISEGKYGIGYGNYGQESKCGARGINSGICERHPALVLVRRGSEGLKKTDKRI